MRFKKLYEPPQVSIRHMQVGSPQHLSGLPFPRSDPAQSGEGCTTTRSIGRETPQFLCQSTQRGTCVGDASNIPKSEMCKIT